MKIVRQRSIKRFEALFTARAGGGESTEGLFPLSVLVVLYSVLYCSTTGKYPCKEVVLPANFVLDKISCGKSMSKAK